MVVRFKGDDIMLSHQDHFEPKLIDQESGSDIQTYRHPHCPGWRIILRNSNIPLATSDTGIKAYFKRQVAFQFFTDALNSRQKKGPTLGILQHRYYSMAHVYRKVMISVRFGSRG
jgi:hypothetical protein